MYKYKRGINNIEHAKLLEYSISNNLNTCLCMSGALNANKPYNGIYIKNGKIIVENIVEEIEIKNKIYKIGQIFTSLQDFSCDEYIFGIDLLKNTFNYVVDKVEYEKSFVFSHDEDMLCIEYKVKNNGEYNANFKIMPLVTYRELFFIKNASMLKFNQRHVQNGTIINLSVMNEENIILKSDFSEYTKEVQIVSDVRHEFINKNLEKQIYKEDLFIPGNFEITVAPNETKCFHIYISDKDFNLQNIDLKEIYNEDALRKEKIDMKIANEFVELKDLALSIDNLSFKDNLVTTLPYYYNKNYNIVEDYFENMAKFNESLDILIDIVKSIDGQYLTFDKIKEANTILVKVRRSIRELDGLKIEDKDLILKINLLKLWYIEASNRVIQKHPSFMDLYIDFIKEILYSVLDSKYQKIVLSEISSCALSYNAVKIYENVLSKLKREDLYMSDIGVCIQNLIVEKFWNEEKRTMKKNINDEFAYPNIDMIYTLSLSYPCIHGDIPIKLLDTIFKELYTPYGLRAMPKSSITSDGLIYPEYMAHFVKANLRQNGVTRASQKIAFNLVKELIQDIGKYVNGGIKKIYHEKGILVDSVSYDLLTNAEMIRLYDMLT